MLFNFAHLSNIFGFTNRQTIWANTIASEVKATPQIWQIHTPAPRFTRWRPTIKNCAALVTNKSVHNATIYLLIIRACVKGRAKSNNFSMTISGGYGAANVGWLRIFNRLIAFDQSLH